jgi:predicted acetyltransferase
MFVNGKIAYFGKSFTLPQFRQSGAHRALLAARLNAAAEQGLEVAYTDVEHGSQSHYNCERAGFRTLTINTIWTKRA